MSRGRWLGACRPCENSERTRRRPEDGTRTIRREEPLRVLSLGAGVQSSTVFLMACHGELELDAAVFADTGWEPVAVYQWLETVLEPAALTAGIPLIRVSGGSVRDDPWEMPLHVVTAKGKGIINRQCTRRFKIAPVRTEVRRLLGATDRPIAENTVQMHFGISWEETERMSDPPRLYMTHHYPLVDRRMTRADCQAWLVGHGYPEAPRSSCIGCPYRSEASWLSLTEEEFADAVAVDESLRSGANRWRRLVDLEGEVFLHSSGTPLRDVVFDPTNDTPNGDCSGFCHV